MKKILPILIIFGFIFSFIASVFPTKAWAQVGIGVPSPTSIPVEGQLVHDAEVTFVGKTAARSGQFLDWTLGNYSWLCVVKISENQCDNTNNPLIPFWIIIRNIVYAIVALFVLATAFILIVTRGQSVTVMKFIPRFVFVLVFITISFSIVQFIYQMGDIVQDFFLKSEGKYISTEDLLYIGFDYETFTGLKRAGIEFEESAFISLLLVKLTAITYYVMTGILLIRKIILWFFIVLSPVFPLLIFYRPIRNTAKIWVGEFFRWLLYAPLFAIFLHGLVVIWRAGIPLPFDFSGVQAGKIVYPTAINILIGGPGQVLSISNSVNLRDTFALYVVALLMLWVAIILPFILLKIFLDYLNSLSLDSNIMLKQFVNRNFGFLNPPKGIPQGPQPPPPSQFQPTGVARTLPFFAKKGAVARPIEIRANIEAHVRESADVLRLTNLSIPKMRDIARFETSMLSSDIGKRTEVSQFHSTLSKISNPNLIVIPSEKEQFSTVRQKLVEQKQRGNPIASSVLTASQIGAASQIGEIAAAGQAKSAVLHRNIKEAKLPDVNRVQQVSLDDYEEVRKLWVENYQTIEPPKDLSGQETEKRVWIKNDMDRINQAITLLNSPDGEKINQGMEMVANILPFLLIGGFSKSEVIAYLKAKLEAGKSVLADIEKKETEEESMVETKTRQVQKSKELGAAAEQELPDNPAIQETTDIKDAASISNKKENDDNKA